MDDVVFCFHGEFPGSSCSYIGNVIFPGCKYIHVAYAHMNHLLASLKLFKIELVILQECIRVQSFSL
jgi:hypothetical protein